MLTKFWEGLGTNLAEQFVSRALGPVLVFWAGGLAAWTYRQLWGSIRAPGWRPALGPFAKTLQGLPVTAQIALLATVLAVLIGSSVAADRLTLPVLRLLEGYWPDLLARRLRRRHVERYAEAKAAARKLLVIQDSAGLDPAAAARLGRLQDQLRRTPETPNLVMPTRLGNLLRGAEQRAAVKYGLDSVVCWPRLWLVLDDETRDSLTQARASLNSGARTWLWGALLAVWTVWAWWALPVAVAICLSAYYISMLSSAQVYGDLVEAAFDLHRAKLYRALRWPLPSSPEKERADGQAVTIYLSTGIAPAGLEFAPEKDAEA